MAHIFSLNKNSWNTKDTGQPGGSPIGGLFKVDNLSGGFHGILQQWWDHYTKEIEQPKVLLVSETNKTKKQFENAYLNWHITTLDLYSNLTENGSSDLVADICVDEFNGSFDLIINQALLEHIYDPMGAMKNMVKHLNAGGYLITHTCAKNFGYHQYPRDYMRFMIDWWYDLPKYIKGIKLLELFEDEGLYHVFSCYIKE